MFYLKNHGALVYAVSDAIAFPHGFSTRTGGVSTLAHLASMNFALTTGDSAENVAENYRIFLRALELLPESRVSAHQIHSARVRYVTAADRGKEFDDCDGFVTDCPDVTLVVKTADCVPILFADAKAGVIAAVHAGWKGTVNGIARTAVCEMEKLGASPADIRVAIGACIHECCFEVQSDFVETVTALRGAAFANAHIRKRGDSVHADLVGMNLTLLAEAGIAPAQIDVSADCTCCSSFLYHSHRATGGKRGAMAAAIGMKENR